VIRALDTNTISDFLRGVSPVVERMLSLQPADLAVPTIVEFELRAGLERLPESRVRRERLQALSRLLAMFEPLPFDSVAAGHAAQIAARLFRAGTPIGPHDVLIAGIARAHGAVLVTRNTREFGRVPDLALEDWHQPVAREASARYTARRPGRAALDRAAVARAPRTGRTRTRSD